MKFIRKNLLTIVLLILVYSWFFIVKPLNTPSYPKVLGANTNIYLFTQPEKKEGPILDAINNAQLEVLVEVYLLSDREIIDALEAANERGVSVKIILEEHPFGGGGVNNKTKQELEEKGVLIKWSNPTYSLTHEKAIIIDSSKLFILNQNLTTSSFTKNREFNVLDSNPEDVKMARNIFIADWENKGIVFLKSHLLFSPDTSRSVIKDLIENAQETIDIEMEVISDNEMIDLLSQKAKNATVRILAPPVKQIKSNQKALVKLTNAGVIVRTLQSPYVHAKLIMVDNKKAYVGSINLTKQSMDKNRELGIILSKEDDLNLLENIFLIDWKNAQDLREHKL